MTTPATTPAPTPAAAAAPKKGKKLIVLSAVGVLLLGGGAGGYFMTRRDAGNPEAAAEKAAAKKAAAPKGVLAFEPFVVNLTDGGGGRFLRLTVRLLVAAEEAEKLSKDEVAMARTRSAILELLAHQSSDHLVTAEGKAELKKEILEHADKVLAPAEVDDVLFSDFLVQF